MLLFRNGHFINYTVQPIVVKIASSCFSIICIYYHLFIYYFLQLYINICIRSFEVYLFRPAYIHLIIYNVHLKAVPKYYEDHNLVLSRSVLLHHIILYVLQKASHNEILRSQLCL